MTRTLRIALLLLWFELGIVVILLPWTEWWNVNYFLRFGAFAMLIQNPFIRGAISGLGVMNVLLAVQSFRNRTLPVAARS
jgi:hypothetical protein